MRLVYVGDIPELAYKQLDEIVTSEIQQQLYREDGTQVDLQIRDQIREEQHAAR